ncbi:MAG TPA: PH domain-containing protein [Mucilaginibacter sp.]|jgi:hypothetical protein|nr:PH domain-containing protein [Mucilaginibacter sp.]
MEKVFRSKIDLELAVPIAVIIGGTFIWLLYMHAWAGILVVLAAGLFVLHLFATTYYTISGDSLRIKSGFLINTVVDIGSISKITATRNMLSSPALSLDRIEIFYNKYDSVMISPNDKAGFIQQIKEINPRIVFN